MHIVEVLAWFDLEGRAQPLKFIWDGVTYPVASTGRQWEDETGQHTLVMDHRDRVFELVFTASERRWFLKPPEQPQQGIFPA
jgi:hypothetical protein